MQFELRELERYLEERSEGPVQIRELRELGGEATGAAALKQFGYGRPVLVAYQVAGRQERVVFHYIQRNPFGRERDDDRVAAVWLDFKTFNQLPRHVPAVDMVAYTEEGTLRSIRSARELLLVTAYRPGEPYAKDLIRIRDEGELNDLDIRRAEALAGYLADIHQTQHTDRVLWQRRLRDLIGHGEGVMGITDSYPEDAAYLTPDTLRAIEEAANRWRWRLKPLDHRLSQVHGDFHPFNVLFEDGVELHLLDRSRGAWGEPADDVSCMAINYLFFSLQRYGALDGPFRDLHDTFWDTYLAERPDDELVSVIQPWFAWRALVLASPVWYPTLTDEVRRTLLAFARRVMAEERFDCEEIERYLDGN